MAYDPNEVQRVLEEKQQVQKKHFDGSCMLLHAHEPLKPEDSIRMEPGNQQCCWGNLTKASMRTKAIIFCESE